MRPPLIWNHFGGSLNCPRRAFRYGSPAVGTVLRSFERFAQTSSRCPYRSSTSSLPKILPEHGYDSTLSHARSLGIFYRHFTSTTFSPRYLQSPLTTQSNHRASDPVAIPTTSTSPP